MIAVEPLDRATRSTSQLAFLRTVVTEPAADRLTALAARLLNARASVMVVLEEGSPFIKSQFLRSRAADGLRMDSPFLQTFYNRVLDAGQTMVVGNVLAFPGVYGDTAGVRAFIGVPLILEGSVRGCLCVIDAKVRRWTSQQMGILSDLAAGLQTELELIDEIKLRQESEKRLQQALYDLEIVNAELEAYGHTVAHNIKGPLNTIASFAGLLQMHTSGEFSEETLSNIDEILNGIQKMAEMTDQLLQLAKLRNAAAEMMPVDVTPLVERALSRFIPLLEDVVVDVDPALLPAIGHSAWIEEIFANLIANALTYQDKRKSTRCITIRSVAVGDMVAYEVQDNGIGISPENQKRLFAKFVRLSESHGTRGYGLGLSIVHRLVKRMNGQVEINSVEGEGSTFRFILPCI